MLEKVFAPPSTYTQFLYTYTNTTHVRIAYIEFCLHIIVYCICSSSVLLWRPTVNALSGAFISYIVCCCCCCCGFCFCFLSVVLLLLFFHFIFFMLFLSTSLVCYELFWFRSEKKRFWYALQLERLPYNRTEIKKKCMLLAPNCYGYTKMIWRWWIWPY